MTSAQDGAETSAGLSSHALEALHNVFSRHTGIERVILYGSRAIGTYRPGSDIDLTVTGAIEPDEMLQWEVELDDLLLPQKIDLSLHRFIDNPDLLAHIDGVGRTLYERSQTQEGVL